MGGGGLELGLRVLVKWWGNGCSGVLRKEEVDFGIGGDGEGVQYGGVVTGGGI